MLAPLGSAACSPPVEVVRLCDVSVVSAGSSVSIVDPQAATVMPKAIIVENTTLEVEERSGMSATVYRCYCPVEAGPRFGL